MNLKRISGENPLEIFFFKNNLFTIKWQNHRCIQQGIKFVYVKVTHVLENHYNNESIITKLGHILHIVFHLIKRSASGNSPKFKREILNFFALAISLSIHTPRHCCDTCIKSHFNTLI